MKPGTATSGTTPRHVTAPPLALQAGPAVPPYSRNEKACREGKGAGGAILYESVRAGEGSSARECENGKGKKREGRENGKGKKREGRESTRLAG